MSAARRTILAALFAGALGAPLVAAGGAATPAATQRALAVRRVAAQLLALQKGFVFLTAGEAFKTAAGVPVRDAKGLPLKTPPQFGAFVRLTFDASGTVTAIDVASAPFEDEDSLASVEPFSAVTPLVRPTGPTLTELRNERVSVAFVVQVPTTTLPSDDIYMETSETSWNPLAVRMDRIDRRHFRAVLDVPVGSRFRYLYTRGNSQSIERGANGLQRPPRALLVRDMEGRTVLDKVDHWGDEAGTGVIAGPQTSPTPFNPAPYPNLPPAKLNPALPHP